MRNFIMTLSRRLDERHEPAVARGDAPAPASPGTPPKTKPTTQDEIRAFGDNIEEIGNTGEKAGEAIEKFRHAFDGKSDANP
jgi:hypothetical protein